MEFLIIGEQPKKIRNGNYETLNEQMKHIEFYLQLLLILLMYNLRWATRDQRWRKAKHPLKCGDTKNQDYPGNLLEPI